MNRAQEGTQTIVASMGEQSMLYFVHMTGTWHGTEMVMLVKEEGLNAYLRPLSLEDHTLRGVSFTSVQAFEAYLDRFSPGWKKKPFMLCRMESGRLVYADSV